MSELLFCLKNIHKKKSDKVRVGVSHVTVVGVAFISHDSSIHFKYLNRLQNAQNQQISTGLLIRSLNSGRHGSHGSAPLGKGFEFM